MKHLLFCIISLLSFLACVREDVPSSGSFALKEGDPLPAFSIANRHETISVNDLKGKTVLIIFFSTTCRDCQQAFPDINALYKEYEDNPSVRVLLIARDETEEQASAYFRKHDFDMEFFPDPERKVYSLFAGNTIPRVFLADKNGTIILTQTEKVDADEIQAKVY